MRRLIRIFSVLALATAFLPVSGAVANPYPVTSTASGGPGSLRESIELANAHMGADAIPIEVTGTIALEAVLPSVTDHVAITGPGAESLTIRRGSLLGFRIFDFSSGVEASLAGMTITNGVGAIGGGINNGNGALTLAGVVVSGNEAAMSGGSQSVSRGGGIASLGPLTLRESVVSENVSSAGNGSTQTVAQGGGISALGPLLVDRSTIAGNTALAAGAGVQTVGQGGGLQALGKPAVIEKSTISGNSVEASGGTSQNVARAGGVLAIDELTLTGSTLSGNAVAADIAASANLESFGATVVRNTIVANPIGTVSCGAPLASGGFNLDEDSSCGFGQPTDLDAVDPVLLPLGDNGGLAPTHGLPAGSAAIDRGNAFGSPIDQRGLPRPNDFANVPNAVGGDGSDIGAFESQATVIPPPTPIPVSQMPADRNPPNTRVVSGPPRVTFERLAKFRFSSTEAQSSFQCKVDIGRWRACRNPFKRKVSPGRKHVFRVRAIDRFGNVDPTPARFGWRVKKIGG
jgi:hypothetical protein